MFHYASIYLSIFPAIIYPFIDLAIYPFYSYSIYQSTDVSPSIQPL